MPSLAPCGVRALADLVVRVASTEQNPVFQTPEILTFCLPPSNKKQSGDSPPADDWTRSSIDFRPVVFDAPYRASRKI